MTASDLDAIFHALADPTRRAILERLAAGPATVGELAEPFSISAPAISRHLKVLDAAGLTVVARRGQSRPRALAPEALQDAAVWTERFRATWEARHDALATYLMDLQEGQHDE